MSDLEDIFKDIPWGIKSLIPIGINPSLTIYNGAFQLKFEEEIVELIGEIGFRWSPHTGIFFSSQSNSYALLKSRYELIVNSHNVGTILIDSMGNPITGIMRLEAVFGDTSIPVPKVSFTLLNTIEILGESVRWPSNGISLTKSRLTFKSKDFIIILDRVSNYDELKNKVDEIGGHFTSYIGELIKNEGEFTKKEVDDLLNAFSYFMSFVNGRRTSPYFRIGLKEDKHIWSDYTTYHLDSFKTQWSWPRDNYWTELNPIWNRFYEHWSANADDRHAIKTLMHWYVSSNNYAGFAEGSIILTQTGLELFFNWFMVDKLNRYQDKEKAVNNSAQYKIGEILNLLQLKHSIPEPFEALNSYMKGAKLTGAPSVLTSIRNALVHATEEKRKQSLDTEPDVIHEAYNLGLLYLELAILFALDYQGIYKNRCQKLTKKRNQYVPWAKKT